MTTARSATQVSRQAQCLPQSRGCPRRSGRAVLPAPCPRCRKPSPHCACQELICSLLHCVAEVFRRSEAGEATKVKPPAHRGRRPRAGMKELQDVWESLKAFVLALGDDVQMKELEQYVAFRRLKNFACVRQQLPISGLNAQRYARSAMRPTSPSPAVSSPVRSSPCNRCSASLPALSAGPGAPIRIPPT